MASRSCWRFFYCRHELRQGALDSSQPHPGQMMPYGASRNGDTAPLFKFLGYGGAGGPPRGDDIDGKLLDQLGLHPRGHNEVLLLALPSVNQGQRALLT